MPQQNFQVSGRTFRTRQDYIYAQKDAGRIEQLRQRVDYDNIEQLQELYEELEKNTYQFQTLLGEDFLEEVEERITYLKSNPPTSQKSKRLLSGKKEKTKGNKAKTASVMKAKKTAENKKNKSFEIDEYIDLYDENTYDPIAYSRYEIRLVEAYVENN